MAVPVADTNSDDKKTLYTRIPIQQRKCTDILFLVLFIVFWCLNIVVFGFVLTFGDLNRLRFAEDYQGSLCTATANFPLALYPRSLFSDGGSNAFDNFDYSICAEECYQNGTILCEYETETVVQNASVNSNANFTGMNFQNIKLSVPLTSQTNLTLLETELAQTRYNLLASCLADSNSSAPECPSVRQTCWPIAYDIADDPEDQNLWKIIAGITFAFTVLYTLILIALWTRIRLAIALTRLSGKAMLSNLMSITVLPLATATLVIGTWIYSIIISAMAISMQPSDATASNLVGTVGNLTSLNITYEMHDDSQIPIKWALFAFTLFMCLWTTQVVLNCCNLLVSLAVTRWYWSNNDIHSTDKGVRCCGKGNTCTFPLNCYILFRFHFGTVSFSALLIALLQFVRAIFEFIRRRIESTERSTGASGASILTRAMLAIVACCLWCLERLLLLITESALVITALEGTGFCRSAARGVSLIASNAGRYFASSLVTRFIVFAMKLIIALLCTLGFWLYLWYVQGISENVSNWLLPLAVTFAMSYLVATSFFHIYNLAVTSIFISFVIDEQKNGRSSPFAPKLVRKLMSSV
eukprot:g3698.t1